MQRFPPLSLESIASRLSVDLLAGKCFWKDPTKHHMNLLGKEAGNARKNRHGGFYWVIKLSGIPYKRAQIILMVKTGKWPAQMVDHENGDSLDDRALNLRHATGTQNAWNHRTRAKKSPLPMGVREVKSGRFEARIACEKKSFTIGLFDTPQAASAAYINKRKELFNEYSGL